MNRRRRLSVWVTTALAVPLLAATACQSSTPPDQAAPTSDSSSPAPDELGKMQKKVDDAQHAIDAADVNGNADNSEDAGNSGNSGNSGN